MKRRDFLKNSSLSTLALAAPTTGDSFGIFHKKNKLIKPKRLSSGATVGLVAPASPTSESNFERAVANLKALGYLVKLMPQVKAQNGYLAGTDEQRLLDLHQAFGDAKVDGIWCLRGGYGCARLLPKLDFGLIKKYPKMFIGYSDITALHVGIHQKTGLVTFHGPMSTSDYNDLTIRDLKAVISTATVPYSIEAPKAEELLRGPEFQPEVILQGEAEGRLIGGNLSLLSALCGTPFQPKFKGKIVFIEDVGEKPYRIDRMLTQLLQSTDLHKAAGIALGVFADCLPKEDERSLSLMEMFYDRLGHLAIPIVYGLPFGHIPEQATLPVGILTHLDASAMRLTFLENAVVA